MIESLDHEIAEYSGAYLAARTARAEHYKFVIKKRDAPSRSDSVVLGVETKRSGAVALEARGAALGPIRHSPKNSRAPRSQSNDARHVPPRTSSTISTDRH